MLKQTENNDELTAGLRRLGPQRPPAGSWRRIRQRAEAEGLFVSAGDRPNAHPGNRPGNGWAVRLAGAALAAGLLLALFFVSAKPPESNPDSFTATPEAEAIDALMRQSSLLEKALRLSPPGPRVVRVGLASRKAAAEDRIAAIDRRLLLGAGQLESSELVELWSERTVMMNTLIELRSSQSGQTML